MFKHVAYLVILGSCTVAALAGNGWRTMVVDSSPGLSFHTSLAVLPSGAPAISYHKEPYLRYATLDGQEWKATVVDAKSMTGHHTSLTILPNGQPAISYYRYDTATCKDHLVRQPRRGRRRRLTVPMTSAPGPAWRSSPGGRR